MWRAYYQKRTYVLSTDWVAVVAPITANYWALRNRGSHTITTRSVVDDEQTEDVLLPGLQEAMLTTVNPVEGPRIQEGETMTYAKSEDGSILTVTWLR